MSVRSLNFFEQNAGMLFLAAVVLVVLALVGLFVIGEAVTVEVGSQTMTVAQLQSTLQSSSAELARRVAPGAPVRRESDLLKVPEGLDEVHPSQPPQMASVPFGTIAPAAPAVDVGVSERVRIASLPVKLLEPAGKPRVYARQSVALVPVAVDKDKFALKQQQINYVVVAAQVPFDSVRAFVSELRRQGGDKVPVDVPPLLDVRLQRQLVDENDQPIGPVETVSRFFNVPQTDIWETGKPLAYPGLTDREKYQTWAKSMQDFRMWLENQQMALMRPRMFALVNEEFKVEPIEQEEREWRERQQQSPPDGLAPGGGQFVPGAAQPAEPLAPTVFVPGQNTPAPAPVLPAPVGPEGAPGLAPQDPLTKPLPNRAVDNKVWVYAIDNKVAANKRYRYQLQYMVINPLLNLGVLEPPQRYMVGVGPGGAGSPDKIAWSPWSDPVQTASDLQVFLARGDGSATSPIEIEVFRLEAGRWFPKSYRVEVGVPVGGPERARAGGQELTVDFSTGLTPVDIRRDAEVTIRRGEASETSAPVLETVRTVQVVFMDAKGNLQVRNVREDVTSRAYAEIRERIDQQDRPAAPEGGRAELGGMR